MATIGTASITLTDISDAIIAGSMPASTNPGQLWIDTSGATNVLKVYKNGQWLTQELDVESMDSHLKQTIQTITDTLGTISDDNKLNHADRVMIVDSLADILGVVPSTKATNKYPTALPDYTVLDANGSGTFASYRSSAIALGIEDTSSEYIELKDAYLALINYLQLLASGNVMPWDITEAKKGTILDVDSDQFRQTWLDYYMAEQALVRRILEVPGPAGAPAISGILDNDSVTIPTKADGTGGIYTRASTKMLVYVGDTNDTAKWSFSAAKDPSAGIVGTLTGNLYVVSSMAADTGYVDLTASREGYASVSKRFSLTKAKQGDTVVDYWVETDYPVIVKDSDDVYTPTALTITAHTQTGTELPKSFSGIIKIEESNDGKVYTSKYTSTKPESSKVWTPSAGIKSVRIKLLTADGANQLDYEIVQVVADGKDGADGYSPIYSELTNESMTITTDVNGANGGYGGAESTIHIYQGQVEVTDQYNISVAISEGSGITGTRTGSTYKVTKMTADSGYVDFIATRSGHLTLTRRFTISKSKTGAAGKPATSRWLTLDTPVIRKMVTGAYFPASITMKAWQATGDQAPTAYTGRFRISINTGGSTYTVKTTTGDVTSHTYSVPENVTGIKIELLSTGGATWLDEETIQVIQDGKDGAPGKDGLSAVVGFLTNENISVQATYNGAVSNYGHVKGTFEVYYGNTRVTGSNVSYSVDTANTSNLTVDIDPVTGAYKVTGITSGTSVTSGVATLKAVYEGVTITKVLTVTKSMAGTNGGNATAYWMITSAGIVSRTLDAVFTPSTITFTGKSKTGTAAPTNYSGRFVVEQTTNGSTWTSLSNTGKNVTSVTVTPTGAAIAVRAKFYLAGGTSVLLDEQSVPIVTDITDEVLTDIKDDIDDKTGTGLWKLDTYMGTTDLIPDLKHTRDNTKLVKSDTIKDFTNSAEYTADTDKVYHLYTHLETAAATNIALKVDHTAGIRILVNGGEPIYTSSVSGLAKTVTLPLTQGWNTVDILLRSTTAGAYVKFDKLISASVVKMSSYLGGGVSTSRLLMMQDEISFAVVQGERVAGLTITNDVINGANVEISGDTTFKDDLVMDAGLIQDANGEITIDLNKGEINLSKPLTINYVPVATKQQLEEIELTPGKSAYELAVDAGFVGTESQWRASLKGESGYTPVKGTDYFDGKDGDNGTSSHLWVMYSQNANGSSMVDSPTDAKYIGVATTTTNTKPTAYSAYKWSLVRGTDGVKGEAGANGKSSYVHIKYSDDGTTFTANSGEAEGKWIGVLVDFVEADSLTFSDYTWNKVAGEDGSDGSDAKLLYLSATAETMTFNSDNTPNPTTQTVSFTANLQNTTGTATFTATPYNGAAALTNITLGGSGNTRTLTQAQFPATATRIQITATLGGLSDTVSVVKLKNGATGGTGAKGDKGDTGAQGKGISSTLVQYKASSSGTTEPTGTWSATVPAVSENQYLWTKTTLTYTDGKTTTAYSVGKMGAKGPQGPQGSTGATGKDGTGISSTSVTYQSGSSGTTEPTGTWSATVPNVADNQYLWTRIITSYTDGSSATAYSVGKMGAQGPQGAKGAKGDTGAQGPKGATGSQGPKGATGVSISSVTEKYLATSASSGVTTSTSGWTEKIQTITATNKYLWNYEIINFSDGSSSPTIPVIVGAYGDKGQTGSTGATGRSITKITEHYLASNLATGVTRTTSGWTTTMQKTDPTKKYLWNYETITWSSGTTTTYVEPIIIGIHGEQGPQGIQGPQGATGSRGPKGDTGTSVSSVTEYYLATSASSGVTTSTSGWKTTIQTMTATNKYLWNYEQINFSDGTNQPTIPVIIGVYGDKGQTGSTGATGRSITAIQEYYLATSASTGVTRSTANWSTTMQTTTPTNKYLWNYEKITWSSGTITTYVEPIIIGIHGEQGPQGIQGPKGATGSRGPQGNVGVGVTSITEHYLATTASSGVTTATSGWTTTIQTIDATKKYLWNYEKINFSDNTNQPTIPVIIGVYGDKGQTGSTGSTGATGRSITGITEHYLATSSATGVTRSTSGWKTTMQTTTPTNKYLWNYETITWSSGTSPTYVDPIIIGIHGEQGPQGPQGKQGAKGATGSQGPTGATGTSVTSITEYYLATSASSGIESTNTGFKTTMQPLTATNKYLWNYEKVNFSNGTSQPTIPVIIGVYGDKGNTGATGRSITAIQEYYMATSASKDVKRPNTDGTNGWATTMQPTTETNKYLWNYEKITWSSAPLTTYVEPIIIGVHGAKGPQGSTGPKGATGSQGPKGAQGPQGPKGTSPIVGLLTNESITLPASSAGAVSSFTEATGTFEVYDGTTRKTGSGVSYSVSGTPSNITASIDAKTGVYKVTAMPTGASVLSGTATLRAVYGGVTIDKILTVTKALAGTQGAKGSTGAKGATGDKGATGATGAKGATGASGKDGVAGKDGKGISSTVIAYVTSTSGTTAPTTGYTPTVPSLTKGQYLWTRTIWTYTDNTTETGYSVSYIAKDGNNGTNGIAGKDGVGIKSTSITYTGSTSGTVTPTSGWNKAVPTVAAGSFLWTRTIWTYTDNTTETGYSVARMGSNGAPGAKGATGGKGATGATGASATSYWINASVNAIKKDATGTIVPKTITFSGFSKTGTANPVAYAGRFIIQTSTNGTSYTNAYTSKANQSSYTYTIPATASFVKARYYLAGGTTVLLDEQTVPVLVDAEGIEIGGRNLYRNSGIKVTSSGYNIAGYNFAIKPIAGEKYTLSIKGKINPERHTGFYTNIFDGTAHPAMATVGPADLGSDGVYRKTFTMPHLTDYISTILYSYPLGTYVESSVEWIKLEKGNKATDWTEAPEDVEYRIGQKADASVTDGLANSITDINTSISELGIDALKEQLTGYQEVLSTVGADATDSRAQLESILSPDNGRMVLLENNIANQNERWNTLDGFIEVNGDQTALSINKGSVNLVIDSEAITFYSGGSPVATITNQYMKIDRGIFVESMHVGRHKFAPLTSNRDHFILNYVGDAPD